MMQLNNVYQRDDFIRFLEEDFLTDFKRDIRPVNTSSLTCIGKAQYLGESKDLDLQVFEFIFEGSANKRVALTKDAFSVMRSSAIYNALAVFHTEDNKDWRFSLLTATPEPTEKGKVSLTYSNPKRLSFFLGPNAKVNTPTKFLISKGKVVDFDDLKSRFSIEVVNKEFYKEISQAFTELVSGQLKLPSTQDKSQTNLEFAVRLIGRIIFCWFLREKKSDAGLSLMPKELLSIEAVQENKDFYHSILEPIFFEVLNKPIKSRRDDFAREPFSSVPYLNGGLFSPQEDDFYKRLNGDFQSQFYNTLVIPDKWLNSFFEILETYNFTIDENTSYDEELSIDPEMLGRIFENLLAEINPETGESARKSTGSYYTPRTIVNYMVDESLLLYLKEQTGISEEKLRAIISYDLSDDSENPVNTDEKEKIIEALEKVKILDPACGSGAFPIGALQKIVFILQQTDSDGQLWFKKQIKNTSPEVKRVIEREFEHKNFDYIRKLGIIRENIYGVDIQAIATEISRLRCFLTLIVDERIQDDIENRGIEPLPNLDFKFVTANSLIGLPKIDQSQQSMFDDYQKIDDLKNIRDQYFNASGIEREQLKTEFVTQQKRLVDQLIKEHGFMGVAKAELTQKLTDWEPFTHKSTSWFDPEWMFGIKDGFDVVIANPPYISYGLRGTQKMSSEERKAIVKLFPDSAEYKISIYALFMDKAIQLCRTGGIQTYIVPDSFLLGRYFSKIRTLILDNCEISHISWLPYKIFEAVVGYSVVYTFLKTNNNHPNHKIAARFVKNNDEVATNAYIEFSYPQAYFSKLKHHRFRLFFSRFTMDLVQKIELSTHELSEYVNFSSGLISKNGQKNIVNLTKLTEEWKPGIISGGEIKKYVVKHEGYFLHYKREIIKSGYESVDYFSPKLFVRQTGDSIICAYDDRGLLALNNVHIGNHIKKDLDLKYITAILNSRLIEWYYKTISLESGRTMAQTDIETIGCLPIKLSGDKQKLFIELVNSILKITADDDYLNNNDKQSQVELIKNQIDQEVYDLYGLSSEEIAIVEGGQNGK